MIIVVAALSITAAAGLHLWMFILESVLFGRPTVHRMLEVRAEHVRAVRPWAFHQGVYNLVLATTAIAGLVALLLGRDGPGRILVMAACAGMLLAGVALFVFDPRLARLPGMLAQALPALVAVVTTPLQ
ncbi:DUF1304 domain-containing protein [Pseudonocardia kujensis]|uniref:DUF1304 family protein n=1 Tax=Pseudonocardia kujensis TaxID=1128675 RepID=UPI001E5BDA8D|nr:DUF1304 family protein [Pseudonocardia kujensis]MCE0762442.1 DUF1304 domain-containing protein [Pseudonocardia kujensis]